MDVEEGEKEIMRSILRKLRGVKNGRKEETIKCWKMHSLFRLSLQKAKEELHLSPTEIANETFPPVNFRLAYALQVQLGYLAVS